MTLQPSDSFEDYKNYIMSAKEEKSGELVPIAQYMLLGYESRLEVCKTEIDTQKTAINAYESLIDEYKDKLKKSNIAFGCAVVTTIGGIASALITSSSNVSVANTNNYASIEKEFTTALKDIGSKEERKVIDAIGVIETHKDQIFRKKPEMQWKTVSIVARAIQESSAIKNKSRLEISQLKYGSFSQKNVQKLIDLIRFEAEKDVNFDIKGRPTDNSGIIDLSDTFLYNIDFSGAKLPRTNFNRSILKNANMTDANLKNSFFIGAELNNANISRSNLTKSTLSDRNNQAATNLIGVKLNGTNLNHANLKGAKLFYPNEESRLVAMEKIKKACNLSLAEFDPKISNILGLSNIPTTPDVGETCEKSIK
jgi:uncharacterized protein YjbI with pentapeptide repeats